MSLSSNALAYRYGDVAQALGVTVRTIQWYVSVGYLQAVGAGTGRRIVAESLRRWIEWRNDPPADFVPTGVIYLIRFRHYYKIGLSKEPDRRFRNVSMSLPEPAELIHTMPTNDLLKGEADLHTRFAIRRTNGEWFKLTKNEVSLICAFKALVF